MSTATKQEIILDAYVALLYEHDKADPARGESSTPMAVITRGVAVVIAALTAETTGT